MKTTREKLEELIKKRVEIQHEIQILEIQK